MFTAEQRVGRLVEARVMGLRDRADADRYSVELGRVIVGSKAPLPPVLCADHRPVAVYSQDVSDRLSELFGAMNSKLARVAILVSPTNATLRMQLARIVREAGFTERRVFVEAREGQQFLDEVLDAPERARLNAFLHSASPERA